MDRTDDGRPLKLRVVLDEWTRERLAIRLARWLGAPPVLEVFADLMEVHGVPAHLRSDIGPEIVATTLQIWLGRVGAGTLYREVSTVLPAIVPQPRRPSCPALYPGRDTSQP